MKKTAFILALALASSAQAAEPLPSFVYPGTVPASSWSAKWIGAIPATPEEAKKQNLWSAYRKEFQLAAKPQTAIARIAVDSKYWLWVNGALVVREGALKRGPTPRDTFFDEIDLAPHLKDGANTVAILVWYFGKEGFSHKSSGRSGLLFQMEAGAEKVVSDASWRARVHPAFGDTGAPHPNMRLPESNIRYDAAKEPAGWQMPGFDAAAWAPAEELGTPDCAPWGRLVKRPIPFWKDFGLLPYTNAAELPAVSDGKPIQAKLPYNAQVTPYFKINAKAGEVIKIQTDNYLGGSEPNVRAEYVTRDGEQEFECLGWMNGHEVHYEIPAGIKILDLKFRETGFDTEFDGAFSCDDDFLNRLHTKALRTLYITMRDTYMDCPDRERALWWGDAVNELGATRIGHAVRAVDDPAVMAMLRERRIGIEANLTSNVQTSAVPNLASHPLRQFLAEGLFACINTDDPGISGIDLPHELDVAAPAAGLTPEDVDQTLRNAWEMAFLGEDEKHSLISS